MTSRCAMILLPILFLSACAVGPDYRAPDPSSDPDWVSDSSGTKDAALPARWWSLLGDPTLDALITKAASANHDIGIARVRIDEARAGRRVARSAFWPQAGLGARYTRFEQSLESPGAGSSLIEAGLVPRDVDFYTTSLDASWEIDLFGARRRQHEAATATLESTIAEARGVQLTVLSETANAYFEMLGAAERLDIAASNVAAQARTLELTRRKVETGLARRIDELRAEAQWNAVRALIPSLEAQLAASRYRLAVLTGQRPGTVDAPDASAGRVLPESPPVVPVGLRADLLRRRPDVLAAERRLAAATADIGVARAEFFPKLTLSASYGFEAAEASILGDRRARTTALVPFVSLPVFQGGRLRAQLEAADARARTASLAYEQTVLVALADAESAIAAYSEEAKTYERLDEAASASIRAASIAERLYEQGLADFLTVLDAQRRRDEAADARARSRVRLLLNLSRLYKSLGGGWQV